MSNRIDSLLSRIEDASLREQLAAEVSELQGGRKFGLVFEHHLPETANLPQVKPRRGLKVTLKNPAASGGQHEGRLFEVLRLKGTGDTRVAVCRPVRSSSDPDDFEPQPVEHPVRELVVTAEFGDPVYPGLTKVAEAAGPGAADPDKPCHIVLNAENHHALQTLQWSHEGAVDVIYIDPPYNTGNKTWQYNDKYISESDTFHHSMWLSFMERRLTLAKDLLKPTGVIIVAIGDDEHHRLRMLMDQIFGEQNFISDVVWQGGRKNDSRYISNGADYMLIYARDESAMREADIRWREKKAGLDEALAKAKEIWAAHDGDLSTANHEWKKWLKLQKASGASTDAVNRYDVLQEGTGRPMHTYGDLTWPGGGGGDYDVIHPRTGKPVKTPVRGWLYKDPQRMQEEVDKGRVFFGPDESMIPRSIRYLDEMDTQVALSVFSHDRKATNSYLRNILGDMRFPNPKDPNVLMRWIRIVAPKDAIVLDFFGGSGTTTEAVMRLNAEDGGARQSILVTNNEMDAKKAAKLTQDGLQPGDPDWERWGIFHHVTKPRIETVVTGIREDGSKHSEGLPERVTFFDLEYLDAERIADDRAFEAVLPMLWLRAGARGALSSDTDRDWFIDGNYGVLRRMDGWRDFTEKFPEDGTHAFVVTDSSSEFTTVAAALPIGVEVIRLYAGYLTTFAINTDGRP